MLFGFCCFIFAWLLLLRMSLFYIWKCQVVTFRFMSQCNIISIGTCGTLTLLTVVELLLNYLLLSGWVQQIKLENKLKILQRNENY